jgi:hypothetical protein
VAIRLGFTHVSDERFDGERLRGQTGEGHIYSMTRSRWKRLGGSPAPFAQRVHRACETTGQGDDRARSRRWVAAVRELGVRDIGAGSACPPPRRPSPSRSRLPPAGPRRHRLGVGRAAPDRRVRVGRSSRRDNVRAAGDYAGPKWSPGAPHPAR